MYQSERVRERESESEQEEKGKRINVGGKKGNE